MSMELEIEIQESIIKHLTGSLEKSLRELKDFDKANTELRDRLCYNERESLRAPPPILFDPRNAELENLKNALEQQIQINSFLTKQNDALRLNPPVIIKTNESELRCLREENESLRNDMAKIERIADCY